MGSEALPLQGRITIVTGASRGIGAAIAERLGSAGAHVVAAARTLDDEQRGGAEQTAERIRARGGKAVALHLDMEDEASRARLIEEVAARFGRIDILVNNAGSATYLPTDATPLNVMRAQTETYFVGPWHLCSLALPHMRRQAEARILNIGSCVIDPPSRPYADYFAARGHEALYAGLKTGLYRFSLGLAAELHDTNIAVNILGPVGAVLTPGVLALGLGLTPDMEICEPVEDMAEAALDMLCRPVGYSGQVEFSYRLLDRIGRSSRSLDGQAMVRERSAREPAHV